MTSHCRNRSSSIRISGFLLLALMVFARPGRAGQIVVATTIQAAVDAAAPGDTVRVPPGTYRENVLVTKDRISIEGGIGAVLDGTGLAGSTGILVRPAAGAASVLGFRLKGLRVQNYSGNGVLIIRGDDFRIRRGHYADNQEYGIFSVRSSNGVIDDNHVSGSDDTGIYVGQSSGIRVQDNSSHDCTVGIEVENSSQIAVEGNRAIGNSTGILVVVLPGLQVTATSGVDIRGNVLVRNNRPNPVTDPEDVLARLPSGVGLFNIGGDGLTVEGNVATGNQSGGIIVAQLPPDVAAFDPRIDPFPDRNRVRFNVVVRNGLNPDPKLLAAGLQGADLIFDFSGTEDCWDRNAFQTVFPGPLPACTQ